MFEKLTKTTTRKKKASTEAGLPRSLSFLNCLFDEGFRISYGDLTRVALFFGDVEPSGMSAAQRGAQLVGRLPGPRQPLVCRQNGGYHKNAVKKWEENGIEVPEDLQDRPQVTSIHAAIEVWEASQES